ncbi:NUDIX domain-containing protein [Labilithrix luteola]|nr:NUDIX domain-containing protein [Labilithrix luteola]
MSFPATLVVLVIVTHQGRYLVVQEHDGSWYLPAGRVEHGESLLDAAVRETAEEAGIAVEPTGIIGLDQEWPNGGVRIRVCFEGRPSADPTPKSAADEHTLGARWVTKDELRTMRLRGVDVLAWVERYESGARLPCSAFVWYGT